MERKPIPCIVTVMVLSTKRMKLPLLEPRIHEEVGTRLIVHALETNLSGHKQIKISSTDTDVVHLAISVVN